MTKRAILSCFGGGFLAVVLVAAVVPAFGGSGVFSNKKLKKLVRKEVKKQVKPGPAGAAGTAGAPGSARAGARITGVTGAPTPGTEFGGLDVTKSAAGGYCLRVPFTPKSIVATSAKTDHYARAELTSVSGFGTCSGSLPGYQSWVTMQLRTDNSFNDSDFFVLIN